MQINLSFSSLEEMKEYFKLISNSSSSTNLVENTSNITLEPDTKPKASDDLERLELEEEATSLGIKFRSDIKTSTLQTRVNEVKSRKANTTKREILDAAVEAEKEDDKEIEEFIKNSEQDEEEETDTPRRRRKKSNKRISEEEEVVESPPKRSRRRSKAITWS